MQYLCLHQSNFFLNAKKWKTDDGFSYRVKLTKNIVPNVLKICLENKKKPTQHLPSKYQKEICHTMTKPTTKLYFVYHDSIQIKYLYTRTGEKANVGQ